MNYAQQIKHPNWQKKRLEVLEKWDFTCQCCGAKEDELNIHHPLYKKGALIWQYEWHELQCLCVKCHKDAHAVDEKLKKMIALMAPPHKQSLIAYCHDLLMAGGVDYEG